MPIILDDSWRAILEQIRQWQRNFRATGDGVSFTNGPQGATLTVRQSPGKITSAPKDSALIKITDAATGGGWYTATVWEPPASNPDPASTLSEAALGTAGADCYYANLREVGAGSHDLTDENNTDQKLFWGHRRGAAPDGKPIYVGGDPWMEDCSTS